MDKLPKDNHDSIDATWLMEEPYLDIIPEDPPQETEILYCQCKNRQACIRKVTILATG